MGRLPPPDRTAKPSQRPVETPPGPAETQASPHRATAPRMRRLRSKARMQRVVFCPLLAASALASSQSSTQNDVTVKRPSSTSSCSFVLGYCPHLEASASGKRSVCNAGNRPVAAGLQPYSEVGSFENQICDKFVNRDLRSKDHERRASGACAPDRKVRSRLPEKSSFAAQNFDAVRSPGLLAFEKIVCEVLRRPCWKRGLHRIG